MLKLYNKIKPKFTRNKTKQNKLKQEKKLHSLKKAFIHSIQYSTKC